MDPKAGENVMLLPRQRRFSGLVKRQAFSARTIGRKRGLAQNGAILKCDFKPTWLL